MNITGLANVYCPNLNRIILNSQGITYENFFISINPEIPIDNISNDVLKDFVKIYAQGILERSHLACITSVTRNSRWLESTSKAIENNNVLGFSASLRGLLESAADSHDLMKILPKTLHKLFPYFYLLQIDSPTVKNMAVAMDELEDRLIHFAYARRQHKESAPLKNHTNKSNAEYIKNMMQFGVPEAQNLYGELCELTHPAAASVSCFLDESETSIRFNPNKDQQVINDICTRYETQIELLVQYSINPALLGLSILNRLISDWPCPKNSELASIGKFSEYISSIDSFKNNYVEGSVNLSELIERIK